RLFEKIRIAEFVRYKAKRMSLNKKEYVENLTIQKMYNDLPNFILEKSIIEKYPNIQVKLEAENKYIIDDKRKNNPVNRLLLEHILEYNNDPKEAFNAEGKDKLNKKAIQTIGKPIKSITRLDGLVSEEEIFRGAVYETDSNVYFIMYENNQTKERIFLEPNPSVSVLKAIEKENNIDKIAPILNGFSRIVLSPGDLVYVPFKEEYELIKKGKNIEEILDSNLNFNLIDRIYQTISFTGKTCLFRKACIADLILPCNAKEKVIGEIDWHNKSEMSMDDPPIKIKDVCIKININRLGYIKPIKYN